MLEANPYAKIPEAIRRELIAYVEEGKQPGLALHAALANNLSAFMIHADAETLANSRPLLAFIRNALPHDAHGCARSTYDRMRMLKDGGSTILAKHADLLDACDWSIWKKRIEGAVTA